MGHRTERIRGLLRDDRDHLLLLSFNREPGSGAYELGVLDYGRDRLFCGRLLSDLCEEGVQGSCGGDCAVPDIIELFGRNKRMHSSALNSIGAPVSGQ